MSQSSLLKKILFLYLLFLLLPSDVIFELTARMDARSYLEASTDIINDRG
jgi:hypothetical protein